MPSVSNCPACKEKLSVPDGVADDAMLGCPLCQASFTLSELDLSAAETPPAVVLIDSSPELAADDQAAETAVGEAAMSDAPVEDLVVDAESDVDLAAEVESLRVKTEDFSRSADPAAEDPTILQVQADQLSQEAQVLLAKVGQTTYAAKTAEAKAMALVSEAMGYRKSMGNTLGSLADALETVARSLDEQCEALEESLAEKTPAVEEQPAEETVAESATTSEPAEDESPADVAEATEPQADESQHELAAESPAVEEADEAVDADEPVDAEQAVVDAEQVGDTDQGVVADEATDTDQATDTEQSVDADQAADAEQRRTRLETLRAVASALKARASELREEAGTLLDDSSEYTIQGEGGEGWGNAPWRPDGDASAAGLGAGAFAFGGGEASVTTGRVVRPGRRKKETSFAKELVGIVLGGAAGLLIAYYGLNFFGGVRYDFAKIYLPGIRHTVKHRPAWWPQWAQLEGRDETQQEDGEEQAVEEVMIVDLPTPTPEKPLTPTTEKASKPAKKPKSKKGSKAAPELPPESPLATPPELPPESNQMAPPELGPAPDLSVSPDLGSSSDMSISPDLGTPSELKLSPELMGTPEPKAEDAK